jgi:hypothetical protein
MKPLAWLVALFALAAGITMIVAPEWTIGLRSIIATQAGLLVVAVIRIAIGVVLIMAAPGTRAPKLLQMAGALALGAGLATPLFGVDRTKAVLEWEAAQGAPLMRGLGAFVIVLGGLLSFVLTPRKRA